MSPRDEPKANAVASVKPRLRVAVLLSGTGRTFDHLLAEQRAGRLPIEIVGVVS